MVKVKQTNRDLVVICIKRGFRTSARYKNLNSSVQPSVGCIY